MGEKKESADSIRDSRKLNRAHADRVAPKKTCVRGCLDDENSYDR